jgi:hypothetical protein
MPNELIPPAIRIALRNAVGGWGPYTAREIDDLFNSYGFTGSDPTTPDVGGVRKTAAESYQARIDFSSPEEVQRYLALADEVLQNYPDDPQNPGFVGQRLRRALRQAGITWGRSGRLELPGADAAAEAALNASTNNLWTANRIRVFISHTSSHRAAVGELAVLLNRSAFSCFVAHYAIEPTLQWQSVIEQALRTCDVLLAYVTEDFSASRWTDQEVGWALGREIVIVSLKAGADPYGFFGAYQAVSTRQDETPSVTAQAVSKSIVTATFGGQRSAAHRLIPLMTDLVVRLFCESGSQTTASRRFELLQRIPPAAWTDAHVTEIENALLGNSVIRDCAFELETPMAATAALSQLIAASGHQLGFES